jgi:hypothetical protein
MKQLPLMNLCIHTGCMNKARNKIKPGYCPKHRSRIDRHGCSTIRKGDIKAQGPYCALLQVYRKPTMYWYTVINRKIIYVHRLVAEIILDRPLHSDEVVHHKDGNGLNNSAENLEILFANEHNHISSHRARKDEEPF